MTGSEIMKIRDQLRSTRTPLEGHWEELSHLFMPFGISCGMDSPSVPRADDTNDCEAADCALILANGLASLVIPREEVWYELSPPKAMEGDETAVKAYRNASVVMREYIERSNFYEEAQEFLIEAPVFGTACQFIGDADDEEGLFFKQQSVGTYDIAEDARGRVNTVGRELRLTPDQAAGEFGEDMLPQNIRNKVGKPLGMTEKSTYYHLVMPATERADSDAPESEKNPWRSYVVEENSKKIVQGGGYHEFPFAVHRYRKFRNCVWGFGPGRTGLGPARQLDFMERLADAAAEKAVFPPLVASSSLEGEIAQGGLEITYTDDSNQGQSVRPLHGEGRYDFAKDRLQDKRAQLRKVFHVDMFQMHSQRVQNHGPLSATEANLLEGEKMSQFSPVHGRLVSEFLTPVLTRVFGVLLRKGAFGDAFHPLLTEKGVPAPEIRYKNRIMMALEQRSNSALTGFMNLTAPIVQMMGPEVLDPINTAVIVMDTARNAGFKETWIRTPKEVGAIQGQREQAAQAQQASALAAQAAKTGKDLGQAPPEMQEAMMQQAQAQGMG